MIPLLGICMSEAKANFWKEKGNVFPLWMNRWKDCLETEVYLMAKTYLPVDYFGWHSIQRFADLDLGGFIKTTSTDTFVKLNVSQICDDNFKRNYWVNLLKNVLYSQNLLSFVTRSDLIYYNDKIYSKLEIASMAIFLEMIEMYFKTIREVLQNGIWGIRGHFQWYMIK